MADEVLLKERQGHVGTLILNRPDKGNSLSVELLLKLIQALEEWAKDDGLRTLVITGTGDKAFCGGFDVRSIPTELPPKEAASAGAKGLNSLNPVEQLMDRVKNYPYPTIARLNGYAMGAGFNLAMCCDLRIAADHARLGIPPAKLGLVYHPEGIKQVAEAIGMARAREVFFTGRLYGPEEVREMGLVHRMVPGSELAGVTSGLAEEISENAPLSLKGIKRILNLLGQRGVFSEAEKQETDWIMAQAFLSADLKEGQLAFIQKRKPKFQGR